MEVSWKFHSSGSEEGRHMKSQGMASSLWQAVTSPCNDSGVHDNLPLLSPGSEEWFMAQQPNTWCLCLKKANLLAVDLDSAIPITHITSFISPYDFILCFLFDDVFQKVFRFLSMCLGPGRYYFWFEQSWRESGTSNYQHVISPHLPSISRCWIDQCCKIT